MWGLQGLNTNLILEYSILKSKNKASSQKVSNSATRLLSGRKISSDIPSSVKAEFSSRQIDLVDRIGSLNDANNVATGTGEIINQTGSFVKEAVKDAAGDAKNIGTGVVVAGVVLAPFTAGASLELLPIGMGLDKGGSIIEGSINLIDGEYSEAAFNFSSTLVFGKIDDAINKLPEDPTNLGKQILSCINFALGKISELAETTIQEKKENEEGEQTE